MTTTKTDTKALFNDPVIPEGLVTEGPIETYFEDFNKAFSESLTKVLPSQRMEAQNRQATGRPFRILK